MAVACAWARCAGLTQRLSCKGCSISSHFGTLRHATPISCVLFSLRSRRCVSSSSLCRRTGQPATLMHHVRVWENDNKCKSKRASLPPLLPSLSLSLSFFSYSWPLPCLTRKDASAPCAQKSKLLLLHTPRLHITPPAFSTPLPSLPSCFLSLFLLQSTSSSFFRSSSSSSSS